MKKSLIVFIFVSFLISIISINAFAAPMESNKVVQKNNISFNGETYTNVEQTYLNQPGKSIVKLEFNNFNSFKKQNMKRLSYYSRLFEEKEVKELNIYFDQMLIGFNAQYGMPVINYDRSELNLNEVDFDKLVIWGPTKNNRIILVKQFTLNGLSWLQYEILYK